MTFRDEYEVLTGVPAGYNAFQFAQWPDTRPADRKAKRGTRPKRSKAAQAAHERQVAAKRAARLARSKNFGIEPKAKTRISAT